MPTATPTIAAPLSTWYLISLRPAGQHAGLRRIARRAGARLLAVSTVKLLPITQPEALRAALAAPLRLFTSPAAVRFALPDASVQPDPDQQTFAVGASTAAALRRLGLGPVHAPAAGQQTSEGLLALPALQRLENQSIGLITAPGGRDVIQSTLQARGAHVIRADVYRRAPCLAAPARLHMLTTLPAARTALLVTSAEAFAELWAQLSPAQQQCARRWTVVVSSQRLAELLHCAGLQTQLRATGPNPACLIDTLIHHVRGQGDPVG